MYDYWLSLASQQCNENAFCRTVYSVSSPSKGVAKSSMHWSIASTELLIVIDLLLQAAWLLLYIQGYLIVALRMRMAYLRKPEDKKRGNPDKEKRTPAPPQKAVKPSTGVVPMLPTGEDDASQQRHLKLLQAEMKKVNPNKHIIRDLMARTFPTRWQEILEDSGSVRDILKVYPALKYPDEVRKSKAIEALHHNNKANFLL